MVVDLFRSRAALEAEIWTLRQQINVLRRTAPKRLSFSAFDRLVFAGLYRLFPNICDALAIVKPDTIVRWHRAGLRLYWRWKSRRRGGRPTVPQEIRKLIREMSIANPLWGAPRIHGELLKLGIDIGQRPSIWPSVEGRRPKAGKLFSIIMPTVLRRWICSSSRQSRNEGRLTHPMVYDQVTDRYLPISWDEALAKIGAALRAVNRLAKFWTHIPRLRPNDTQSTW
jgi:hypothetical protein